MSTIQLQLDPAARKQQVHILYTFMHRETSGNYSHSQFSCKGNLIAYKD